MDSLEGDRVVVAFNPFAGSGDRHSRVMRLATHLDNGGLRTTICHDADALVELVHRYQEQGELRGVVAAGGDGTFSLVANSLPSPTPLTIFPLGTENLLARYLGHTANPRELARLLHQGRPLALDAGVANDRLFSLMTGCGFDGEVVDRLHRTRKGNIRHWSYIKPMLSTIRTYAYPRLTVRILEPSGSSPIECCWAFVINVPRYAFGLQVDPQASPCDGQLNVVTFQTGSFCAGLSYLSAVVIGSHTRRDDVCFRTATRVQIEAESPARYQLDGDPGGELPVEIRCAPGRLRVIVSPQWLASANLSAVPTFVGRTS